MSVDYRLLPRFEASQKRHEAARRALPDRWRDDPRPEAQFINELWVNVIAQAWEQHEQLSGHRRIEPAIVFSADDR